MTRKIVIAVAFFASAWRAVPCEGEPRPLSADAAPTRDPFVPADRSESEGEDVAPLERFALSQLRVVGTVHGIGPPRVLIQDPTGIGYIATVGTSVGSARHRIVEISATEIALEQRPGRRGEAVDRTVLAMGERAAE
jgi:Tfp pilus assembly protein PilP